MLVGGFCGAKVANQDVQDIANKVLPDVQAQTNKTYSVFKAVKYTSQVVAGTNYKIKVQVGDTDYIHIKVFVPLPVYGDQLQLKSVEEGKTLEDSL